MKTDSYTRCPWCLSSAQYMAYHDREWGVAVHNDQKHFEFLLLEGAQAGLSWSTILKKRENYRTIFADFNPVKVASFTQKKLETIRTNPGIVRNRLKIQSAVKNAKQFLHIQDQYGSFDNYVWAFVNHKPQVNHWEDSRQIPATTPVSDALSRDLRSRGFTFVGSTIIYAYMQACGLVNDHLVSCFRYKECGVTK